MNLASNSCPRTNPVTYLFAGIAGLLGPLGFAPFNMPGLSILGLAFLFYFIINASSMQSFFLGLVYGLAYFGFGVSWISISIHDYGTINYFFAICLTLALLCYLSLFPALVAYVFKILRSDTAPIKAIFSFSVLWCLSELLRSYVITGFPWLLLGVAQTNTPLQYLAPIIGIYGLSFLAALAAAMLCIAMRECAVTRYCYLGLFISLMISPSLLRNINWTSVQTQAISIAAIQTNVSMRNKWDKRLFSNLLNQYENTIESLLGKQLIILPESAIPISSLSVQYYLNNLNAKAEQAHSALMLGTFLPAGDSYYNVIITLGQARGRHIKSHLVPFGEYIPKPFVAINRWLNLPKPKVVSLATAQQLITIWHHPIATLICYEIAYPNILRLQMPQSEWIVSVSDNGWFGHSLASYQQLQMSQMLSLLTGRYQVVVNNNGLSSLINPQGKVIQGLPAFSAGILQGYIYPATGSTPWIYWGDYPVFILCVMYVIYLLTRLPKQ